MRAAREAVAKLRNQEVAALGWREMQELRLSEHCSWPTLHICGCRSTALGRLAVLVVLVGLVGLVGLVLLVCMSTCCDHGGPTCVCMGCCCRVFRHPPVSLGVPEPPDAQLGVSEPPDSQLGVSDEFLSVGSRRCSLDPTSL